MKQRLKIISEENKPQSSRCFRLSFQHPKKAPYTRIQLLSLQTLLLVILEFFQKQTCGHTSGIYEPVLTVSMPLYEEIYSKHLLQNIVLVQHQKTIIFTKKKALLFFFHLQPHLPSSSSQTQIIARVSCTCL